MTSSMTFAKTTDSIVFAMGCFWCAEAAYRDEVTHAPLPGIIDIRAGYAGGTKPNPTYEDHPGYIEAIKITYDPNTISLEKLLKLFWVNIDPFDADGQFCDKGYAYISAIYYGNETQKKAAIHSQKEAAAHLKSTETIQTKILPLTTFYDAEEYHQNYKQKNPMRYEYYRWSCQRDARLKAIWGAYKE